jgi:hypothetical protein
MEGFLAPENSGLGAGLEGRPAIEELYIPDGAYNVPMLAK